MIKQEKAHNPKPITATRGQIFQSWRKFLGFTLEKAGEMMGVPLTTVWKIEKGIRRLRPEEAEKFWKSAGMPEKDWNLLFTTKASPDYLHPSDRNNSSKIVKIHPSYQLNVCGDVQAHCWRDTLKWPRKSCYDIMMPCDEFPPGLQRFGVEIRGKSMNKIWSEGTILAVIKLEDLGLMPENGDCVIVLKRSNTSPDFEASVKIVEIRDDGKVILYSYSTEPEFQPIILDKEAFATNKYMNEWGKSDVKVWGLVVAVSNPNRPKIFLR